MLFNIQNYSYLSLISIRFLTVYTKIVVMAENSVEEMYLNSAKKLRASLPKFVIFLGIAYLIWLIGTTFFIPISNGVFIKAIQTVKLESFIILAAVLVLIFVSFLEIRKVSDACAGLVASYITHRKSKIEEMRFRQLRRSFLNFGYLILVGVTYLIFAGLLSQINVFIVQIVPALIGIWVVISAIFLAMVLGLEIEESARVLSERIENIRKKIIVKKEKK